MMQPGLFTMLKNAVKHNCEYVPAHGSHGSDSGYPRGNILQDIK